MLLTITYEGLSTQNLGYLLHKHPFRPQEFLLPMGKAYVFYPEVSDTKTTAALLLDLDPLSIFSSNCCLLHTQQPALLQNIRIHLRCLFINDHEKFAVI